MKTPSREMTALLVLSWLLVMGWHLSQIQMQPTDVAWLSKLAVEDIGQAALWAAGWAWVTHIQRGQAHLRSHVALVAGACLLDQVGLSLILPWVFFAQGWPWPQGFHLLSWTALICLTSLVQLRLVTRELTARRVVLWGLASTLAMGLVGLHAWADRNDREGIKMLPYEANIYPPIGSSTPHLNLDDGLKALWAKDWLRSSPLEED